jgi:hypothetical protein
LACDDKNSLLYAQLLNITGSHYYDLNQLTDCRKAWEVVLKIRKEKLEHDSDRIAAILHNLGNLETASGNLELSTDYFERAALIKQTGGDQAAFSLGLTYLCMGRMHMLRFALKEAQKMSELAESLFVRTIGADRGISKYLRGVKHFLFQNES